MNRLNSDHTDKGAAYMLIFFMHIKKFAFTLISHAKRAAMYLWAMRNCV